MYMHTYARAYINIYIHTYLHTYIIHTYIRTCLHAYIHKNKHTYIHTYIHTPRLVLATAAPSDAVTATDDVFLILDPCVRPLHGVANSWEQPFASALCYCYWMSGLYLVLCSFFGGEEMKLEMYVFCSGSTAR